SPRGMGGGDIKLAALVGLYLGWCGWGALVVGAFAAFLFGGVFSIVLLLLRRARRTSAIPFGPWMLAGAWFGIALGEPLGRWYVGLFGIR
ncbi:MAG: prepilin peptidase, partial [Microbacterium sp. 14-71-5]